LNAVTVGPFVSPLGGERCRTGGFLALAGRGRLSAPAGQFLAERLAADDVHSAMSPARFGGSAVYDLGQLSADLERFTFPLSGSDGWPPVRPGQD
jgi:hypothetical protein